MTKLIRHFFADDISSVAEVLKSFDPDNSSSFNRFDETVNPKFTCPRPVSEGVEDNDWQKYEHEMKESGDMDKNVGKCLKRGSLDFAIILWECFPLDGV